jgi:hypothetical protein
MARHRRHTKSFAALVAAAIPKHARGKPIELWWQEEARIGQQGSLTYVWADKGSRPRPTRSAIRLGLSVRRCLSRAGEDAALVLLFVNTAAMNLHLAEISTQVAPGAHAGQSGEGVGDKLLKC